MIVKCHTECFDSKRCRKYFRGDQDDVDPLEPLAMYFTFPPGTTVYHKIKGKSGPNGTPNIETTRVVPGGEKKEPEKIEETCDICKEYKGTKAQMHMHKIHCAKKHQEAPKE
jgi:hypothetical protein